MQRTTRRSRLGLAGSGVAIGLLLLGVSVPPALQAQRQGQLIDVITADGAGPDLSIRDVRRGFNLFASGDAALAGLRMTGNFGAKIDNYGDCNNVLTSCQNQRLRQSRGGTGALWFLLEWLAGAPPSEWIKIRNVQPSVANATGGGFTAGFNGDLIGRPIRFGPHDGTLGNLFSGEVSTQDGTCLDNTGFGNGQTFGRGISGVQVLASSDCTPTWSNAGWQGAHPIDQDGYKVLFDGLTPGVQIECDAIGPVTPTFCFDFWRVPEAAQRLDKMFLGTGFATYGETSDYNADIQASYGSVVPNGTGAPALQGYPLGLLVRFEAFNFAVPTVASVKWVRATVINRSEDVYGTGVDYDSLYFGLSEGTLLNTQTISRYHLPDRGMTLYHNDNARGAGGPCDDSFRNAGGGGCGNGNTSASRGYGNGAGAIIVLKSPIGDLRNKLFTRTTAGAPCTVGVDPFCDPTNPLAGDTITFNQAKFGDFGSADAATWGTSVRAGFGYLSATAENMLDGRSAADLTVRTQFRTFRNTSPFTDPIPHFNKYVPGIGPGSSWDYNHDGTPDTLYLDTCGANGCVVFSQDTLPGGEINRRGNVGGVLAAGPFPLAAGDSTAWYYAVIGDGDSTKVWSQVDAAVDLYMNFFLAPESPPAAEVLSTTVTPGTDQFGTANPQIRLVFSEAPENWLDPFLSKVASDIANSAPGTPLNDLLVANPGLDALVAARAADNLERIEIYKSCDAGETFDADGDCDGDQAEDETGNAAAFGWEAYSILNVDDFPGGDIPNVFVDGAVDGGREYLYIFVAKSRGATFLLNTSGGGIEEVEFAPTIRNTLSRSTGEPNVVSVFVPNSRPAGTTVATANFTTTATASVPFTVGFTDDVVDGSYRAVFGNQIVVDRDSSISNEAVFQSVVRVEHSVTADITGVPTDTVVRRSNFTRSDGEVFPVAGSGSSGGTSNPDPDTERTSTIYSGLGFVVVNTASGAPIFGSQTLTGTAATPPDAFLLPDFPGFTIDADNSVAGSFNGNSEAQLRGDENRARNKLLPGDTVVPRGLVNAAMVQWQQSASTATADAGGVYKLAWSSDPLGVVDGIVLNRLNPAATEAELRTILEARPAMSVGLTDQATADLVGVDITELVAVNAPFTIRNSTYDRPVSIAMRRRVNNRVRLGDGGDTISVLLPEDQWFPGDQLFMIEDVVEDSTTGAGVVLDGTGQPAQRTRTAVSFNPGILGCDQVRVTCNPIRQNTAGATGYNPMNNGDTTRFEYFVGFDVTTDLAFDVVAPVTGDQITSVSDSALSLIRVVPNPFVIFSTYQTSAAESRVLFTNLPSRGTLRIYTVAGQFVQQITYEPADLEGGGDLFYDLRSREGIDIASGLYIWVLTAPSNPSNPNSTPIHARGKFVVIRGDSR